MLIVTKKIDEILYKKNLSRYKLSKIIKCDESYLNHVLRGDRPFSKNMIQKNCPFILEITEDDFKSWILADRYQKETLKRAIKLKQEHAGQDKLIFSAKIV